MAEGAAFIVELTLDGLRATFLNGGPVLKLDDAFSFVLECQTQDEIDHYWAALLADGGVESQCGWLDGPVRAVLAGHARRAGPLDGSRTPIRTGPRA